MYESPITAYIEHTAMNLADEINRAQEEYVYQRVMNLGIYIDKDELIKALQYDRNQYEKGYADAMAVLKDIKSEIDQLEEYETEIVHGLIDTTVRKLDVKEIIDKHCGKENPCR